MLDKSSLRNKAATSIQNKSNDWYFKFIEKFGKQDQVSSSDCDNYLFVIVMGQEVFPGQRTP